jgi:hypothetical protein
MLHTPVDQAGARHSLSPMVAKGGAVMGTECSNAKQACLLVNIAHSREFNELGQSVFEIGKVSKIEQRRRAGCDQVIAERRGEYPRRLSPRWPRPCPALGPFFVKFPDNLKDGRRSVEHKSGPQVFVPASFDQDQEIFHAIETCYLSHGCLVVRSDDNRIRTDATHSGRRRRDGLQNGTSQNEIEPSP